MVPSFNTSARLAWIVALTIVYVVVGRLGLALATHHASATAVWAPTGIAISAVLLLGRWVWPGIAAGAFLVNVTTAAPWHASIGIAVGNTLEALLGAWFVQRWAGGAHAFERASNVFRFGLLAGVVAPAIGATIGVTTLLASGLASRFEAGDVWLTWWLGDAGGAFVVAPVIVLIATSRQPWAAGRAREALLFAVAFVVFVALVFSGLLPMSGANYPISFLCMPLLSWPALRFGRRETAIAVLALAAAANWGTLNGNGPFGWDPHYGLILVQTFAGVAGITAATIAALVDESNRLNDDLERRVADRTEALRAINESLRTEIAERERIQAALRNSESRLIEAQTVALIGSWDWDIAGNTLWWSQELYRIYGLDAGSWTASYESFIECVHPEDREFVNATMRTALKSGAAFTLEHRVIRPDGRVRVLAASGRVVKDGEGRAVRMMGTGQDVTDRKRAEQEHLELIREQAARRQAEEANRLKDQFLAVVSHELRTPLNAVLGWAQMLAGGTLNADGASRAIQVIERNAQAQARLINDLLDVSGFLAGQIKLDRRPVELEHIVRAALDTVEPAAALRRVTIAARIATDRTRLVGDMERLQQVLVNLLTNALKFSIDGGTVAVDLSRVNTTAVICVSDDGVGMDSDQLERVFEPFWQADTRYTRTHGGLGLGLAIVRHLVEAHGGSVRAMSEGRGRGSSFVVELPVDLSER
jgi:PAS domain S-box-containing protein